MRESTKYIVLVVSFIICEFLYSSICIIVGIVYSGSCDYTSIVGFNVAQYLFLMASYMAFTFTAIMHIFKVCSWLFFPKFSGYVYSEKCSWLGFPRFGEYVYFEGCCILISTIMSISLLIIGAVVIFRDNLDCLRARSVNVIFALTVWCVCALLTILTLWTHYPLIISTKTTKNSNYKLINI